MTRKRIHIIFCFLLAALSMQAQENYNLLKKGIKNLESEQYADAEAAFKKVIENNDTIKEAYFNLGNAVYHQNRLDEARENYNKALTFFTQKNDKAETYHNIGNTYMKEQKWEESIKAYKNALKNNAGDMDTKYNLAYALEMLKKEQQQQNQDKNQEQQQDDKKEQQQDQKDKKDDQQKGNQNEQKQEQKEGESDKKEQANSKDGEPKEKENDGKPREIKLSKEEAERLLRAIENEEQKLQDKKKQEEMDPVRIRTDKDW